MSYDFVQSFGHVLPLQIKPCLVYYGSTLVSSFYQILTPRIPLCTNRAEKSVDPDQLASLRSQLIRIHTVFKAGNINVQHDKVCSFVLIHFPVNIFSVMTGQVFLG